MDEIIYTTLDEQIEKLKSHNLIIDNIDAAKAALATFGYSNLIKSYREPYMVTSETGKSYRHNVTFNQIFSLYMLDKNLRNAVIAAMLDLEEHIKEQASDVVASAFGTHQDNYLSYRNYQNKRKRKKRFTLTGIMNTMKETLDTEKDPIHHYKTEHGIVPPWILFKSIYFSTIINFVDQFKAKEKYEMAHRLYDFTELGINESQACKLMMDTLYLASDYRNLAAHGGRIYNYISDKKIRLDEIFDSTIQLPSSGFSQLLFALQLLKYKGPFNHLDEILSHQVNRHCNQFPQDVTYLGQILNMDIVSTQVVYVTDTSNKYHATPHCSGIKKSYQIELEEAQVQGFIPCKRCIK